MSENNRRVTDDANDEISQLIRQENDPERRAFLLILQNINLSLASNTTTVNEIDTQLKQHLIEFRTTTDAQEALLNKGRGVWKFAGVVLGIAQSAVVGMVIYGFTELRSLHEEDIRLSTRLTIQETINKGKP